MRNQLLARWIMSLFSGKKIRFVAAGLLNTAVDFAGFNIAIFAFGLKPWQANLLSTSIAMSLSFIVNKRLVFGDHRVARHSQFIAFLLVTAVGLWGLQTSVVVGVDAFFRPVAHRALQTTAHASAANWIAPNVAKAVATVASAIWNYFWYDRVIFAQSPKKGKLQEWI